MRKYLDQLKVLYLIKTLDVGGAERFVVNLCTYFENKLLSISVFSSGGIFQESLNDFKIKSYEFKSTFNKNPIVYYKILNKLKKIILEENFDIIHCQHRIFLPALYLINPRSSKIIYTAHNIFSDMYQKIIYPDIAIGITPTITENLISTTYLKPDKIVNINYGVEIPDIVTPYKSKLTIGFIGRIIEPKGIFIFLDSIKKLISEISEVNIIIRGNGSELNVVKQKILNLNLKNSVELNSSIIDLNLLYKGVDILVLPTFMNEGLPLSILEAMARKILVISSDSGGIKDVIKNNITGLLIKKKDAEDLYNKMKFALDNYDSLQGIINNAYHLVKNNYYLGKMLKEYEELYQSSVN